MSSILFFFSANSSSRASMTTDSMKSPSASSSLVSAWVPPRRASSSSSFPRRDRSPPAPTPPREYHSFSLNVSSQSPASSTRAPRRLLPFASFVAPTRRAFPSSRAHHRLASAPRASRARDKRSRSTSDALASRRRAHRAHRPPARAGRRQTFRMRHRQRRAHRRRHGRRARRSRAHVETTNDARDVETSDDAPSRSDAVGAIPRGRHRANDDNLIQRSTKTDTCYIYKYTLKGQCTNKLVALGQMASKIRFFKYQKQLSATRPTRVRTVASRSASRGGRR